MEKDNTKESVIPFIFPSRPRWSRKPSTKRWRTSAAGWDKHLLHAERRAAGGDGRYKGADAGRVGLPRQEVPYRESKAESRVQGDALRQTAIII